MANATKYVIEVDGIAPEKSAFGDKKGIEVARCYYSDAELYATSNGNTRVLNYPAFAIKTGDDNSHNPIDEEKLATTLRQWATIGAKRAKFVLKSYQTAKDTDFTTDKDWQLVYSQECPNATIAKIGEGTYQIQCEESTLGEGESATEKTLLKHREKQIG